MLEPTGWRMGRGEEVYTLFYRAFSGLFPRLRDLRRARPAARLDRKLDLQLQAAVAGAHPLRTLAPFVNKRQNIRRWR